MQSSKQLVISKGVLRFTVLIRHILSCTFEWLQLDLIDDAHITVEPVRQGLWCVGIVVAAAGPVGGAVLDPIVWYERVLDGLVGEVVGAGGADALQDAVHGGAVGDEGAAEVGVDPVVPLEGLALDAMAGFGVRRLRRRSAHLLRAGEIGDLRAYPQAYALAEFVLNNCPKQTNQEIKSKLSSANTRGGGLGGGRTESAPGAGDGGGADDVGGVVEGAEDGGGGVGADPVDEVPAAGVVHLHLHGHHTLLPRRSTRGGGEAHRLSSCRGGDETRRDETPNRQRSATQRRPPRPFVKFSPWFSLFFVCVCVCVFLPCVLRLLWWASVSGGRTAAVAPAFSALPACRVAWVIGWGVCPWRAGLRMRGPGYTTHVAALAGCMSHVSRRQRSFYLLASSAVW